MPKTAETSAKVHHLPEHGPIDPKTGREVLLSIRNVDITFGKGDNAVKAIRARHSLWWVNLAPARPPSAGL